ncbi:hypothetical protein A5709_18315 [Mycobacterium sp. E1386]|nr:hypothetical protein A5711_05265 [Mycobacterium sp. E2238]OBI35506.1 hypothetical protein A5709_18315 [Mycobacterium sp. E1386]
MRWLGRGSWSFVRTRCSVGRAWRRLHGCTKRLTVWQPHWRTASGRFDFRQITRNAFEVLGHVAAGLGDVSQRAARSRCACPTGTPSSATRRLRLFPCTTCSGARAVGRRTCLTEARGYQREAVERDFPGAQPRTVPTPILRMHKAFQLLQPRFREFVGIDRGIDQAFFPGVFHQARPGGGRTLWICGDPMRAQVDEAQPHADHTFEDALLGIDPGVGYGRDGVTDVVPEELDEPAARVLLARGDRAIGLLHDELDLVLAGPGFLAKMLEHGIDVLDDLFDLIPGVAVDDEHHIVTEVAQGLDAMQQIPDRGLGVVDLIRERADGAGQCVAQVADSRCRRADFGQRVVDLLAFRNVLAVEQHLGRVESPLHTGSCRTEGSPTRCSRAQTRHVAVGPCLEDKRLHERPQRWRRLAGPPRPRRPGRGKLGRRGRLRQSTASAAQRRRRIDVGVVRRALLYDSPAFPAGVDGGSGRLQHRLGLLLIRQAEHLAGSVNTGVGRKAGRQDRQVGRQRVASGCHRATRGVQGLWVDGQRSHARNSRRDRTQALFTQ